MLATGNKGKVEEIRQLFAKTSNILIPQSEFNIPEAEESGSTFIENAIIKARHAARLTGIPAIADDTGLVVDALNGAPGIYSARYSGPNATSEQNIDKLLSTLDTIPMEKRQANFFCAVVYMKNENDSMPIISQGRLDGQILFARQGDNGFGYDSVFFVPQYNCSVAELPLKIKNQISHRGIALREMLQLIG